jgi:hypothetical protein
MVGRSWGLYEFDCSELSYCVYYYGFNTMPHIIKYRSRNDFYQAITSRTVLTLRNFIMNKSTPFHFLPSKTGLPTASLLTSLIAVLSFGNTNFTKVPITAATIKGVSTMRLIPCLKPWRLTFDQL